MEKSIGLSFRSLLAGLKQYPLTGFVLYLALGTCFFFFMIRSLALAPESASDTAVYMAVSQQPVTSPAFYAGVKPPVTPLIFKIAGQDERRIVLISTLLSAICWFTFAFVLAGLGKTKILRAALLLLVPSIMFWWHVMSWNYTLLTESASFSLLALWAASVILLLRNRDVKSITLWGIVSAVFMFVRDTNIVIFVVSTAVTGILLAAFSKQRSKAVILFSVMIVLTAMIYMLQSRSARNDFSMANVFLQRILTNERYTGYFEQKGMPVDPALQALKGTWASSNDNALFIRAEYRPFLAWLSSKGKTAYALFLVTHPFYAVNTFVRNLPYLFQCNLHDYPFFDYTHPLPRANGFILLQEYIYPVTTVIPCALLTLAAYRVRRTGGKKKYLFITGAFFCGAVIGEYFLMQWGQTLGAARYQPVLQLRIALSMLASGALAAISFRLFLINRKILHALPPVMIAAAVASAAVAFHFDAMEPVRHSIMNLLILQVTLILSLILVVNQLLSSANDRPLQQ